MFMLAEVKQEIDELNNEAAQEIAKAIVRVIQRQTDCEPCNPGCRTFYSQDQWLARNEQYGNKAVLVIVHDGGDFAPFFNWDYCDYEAVEAMRVGLEKIGYYVEQCTSWYSAVYAI